MQRFVFRVQNGLNSSSHGILSTHFEDPRLALDDLDCRCICLACKRTDRSERATQLY